MVTCVIDLSVFFHKNIRQGFLRRLGEAIEVEETGNVKMNKRTSLIKKRKWRKLSSHKEVLSMRGRVPS
jgi:hypothetical protein